MGGSAHLLSEPPTILFRSRLFRMKTDVKGRLVWHLVSRCSSYFFPSFTFKDRRMWALTYVSMLDAF